MADISDQTRQHATAVGDAMPGGRYPIRNKQDLSNAIRAVGRSKGGAAGRAAVRRFIIKRAHALGADSMIPDTWNSDGTLKSSSSSDDSEDDHPGGHWTTAQDHAWDAAHGVKQGSPRDKALDRARGVKN
ncbi:MAG TPA: hypothetical protein VFH54_10905 [Mycobacteriales bacterium]|nr:hypothetical protein [Mycobacteriales bacterium]